MIECFTVAYIFLVKTCEFFSHPPAETIPIFMIFIAPSNLGESYSTRKSHILHAFRVLDELCPDTSLNAQNILISACRKGISNREIVINFTKWQEKPLSLWLFLWIFLIIIKIAPSVRTHHCIHIPPYSLNRRGMTTIG